MRFSKLSLRAAALVLIGVVSSMADGVAPMTFGDSKTDAENWDYLSNFKLWGTTGITFGNRPEFYDSRLYDRNTNENDLSGYEGVLFDTLGWVGTAKGDLSTGEKGWIDGPVIVGGAIKASGDMNNRMTLLTGPVRTKGDIACKNKAGTTCSETANTGNCSYDKVPEIRSNLKVPVLSGANFSGTLNVSGRTILDVESKCSGNDVCDLYYNSINFSNDSRLVVQMRDGGRPTRIFTKSLNFKTHPEIVVNYKGKGDLEQNEYDGNLLIYVDDDIVFENIDNVSIMGTFVSTGTINLICNIVFAGQLIANSIKVGNEIRAENFVFKKFKTEIEVYVGANSKNVKESDKWEPVSIVLNEASTEDVSFTYCFDFYSATGVNGVYAGHQDLGAKDASHAFPICGDSEAKVTIPAGETEAKGIYFKPLIDGLVEDDEALWFQINNLKGAKKTNDYEANLGYKIHIVSNDALPTVSSELVVKV